MEKIIKAGSYEFPAKSTAASLISYKMNFGRDGLQDVMALARVSMDNLAELDVDVYFRFLWVFAKSANPSIPPLAEWLEGFDIEPIDFALEVFPQVQELLGQTVRTSVRPAKN